MTETNMIASNPYDGERRAGHGRLSAAGRQPARRRPRERRAGREGADRRHRGQGPERVQGLLADAGKDGAGVPRRRLLHHRRPRPYRRRRLCPYRRPRQGPHHFRRLQRLPEGGRERDRRARGRRRKRGDRRAASRFRRGGDRGGRGTRRRALDEAAILLGARATASRKYKAPKRVLSSRTCPATRWARCRRRRCGRPTRGLTRRSPRLHPALRAPSPASGTTDAFPLPLAGEGRGEGRRPSNASAWLSRSLSSPCRRPASPGQTDSFFGFSATIASVVISRPATDAASCSAARTTLVGSMMPSL